MIFVPALDAYKNTSSGRIRYLIDQITELSPISAEQVRSFVSWSILLFFYRDLFRLLVRNLFSPLSSISSALSLISPHLFAQTFSLVLF